MKKSIPFLILIASFILCCIIGNYGYTKGSTLIQWLGALVFIGTCIGIITYSYLKQKGII